MRFAMPAAGQLSELGEENFKPGEKQLRKEEIYIILVHILENTKEKTSLIHPCLPQQIKLPLVPFIHWQVRAVRAVKEECSGIFDFC